MVDVFRAHNRCLIVGFFISKEKGGKKWRVTADHITDSHGHLKGWIPVAEGLTKRQAKAIRDERTKVMRKQLAYTP